MVCGRKRRRFTQFEDNFGEKAKQLYQNYFRKQNNAFEKYMTLVEKLSLDVFEGKVNNENL